MRFKVTLELEVKIDPQSDDALIAEEGSIETAAIHLAQEHVANGSHADRVTEIDQRAEQLA